jgi:hypothetical protein
MIMDLFTPLATPRNRQMQQRSANLGGLCTTEIYGHAATR